MIVLVACFPKSGSTLFAGTISKIPGFSQVSLVPFCGGREQELCEFEIKKHLDDNVCAQHHVRAHEHTLILIEKYNISVAVLVRNIFDVVVSLRDHHFKEGISAEWASSINRDTTDENVYARIIDMYIPWYFEFYMSWQRSPFRNHIVRYEDFTASLDNFYEAVTMAVGSKTYPRRHFAHLLAEVQKGNTRKNVGEAGRGLKSLSDNHVDRILSFTKYYPGVDFSAIGIT